MTELSPIQVIGEAIEHLARHRPNFAATVRHRGINAVIADWFPRLHGFPNPVITETACVLSVYAEDTVDVDMFVARAREVQASREPPAPDRSRRADEMGASVFGRISQMVIRSRVEPDPSPAERRMVDALREHIAAGGSLANWQQTEALKAEGRRVLGGVT